MILVNWILYGAERSKHNRFDEEMQCLDISFLALQNADTRGNEENLGLER